MFEKFQVRRQAIDVAYFQFAALNSVGKPFGRGRRARTRMAGVVPYESFKSFSAFDFILLIPFFVVLQKSLWLLV